MMQTFLLVIPDGKPRTEDLPVEINYKFAQEERTRESDKIG